MDLILITVLLVIAQQTGASPKQPKVSIKGKANITNTLVFVDVDNLNPSGTNQLVLKASHPINETNTFTQNSSLTASLTVVPRRPVLLHDSRLQQSVRDKIEERTIPKLQVTHDIRNDTKTNYLQAENRTKVAAIFSGATGEAVNNTDTRSDPRG